MIIALTGTGAKEKGSRRNGQAHSRASFAPAKVPQGTSLWNDLRRRRVAWRSVKGGVVRCRDG